MTVMDGNHRLREMCCIPWQLPFGEECVARSGKREIMKRTESGEQIGGRHGSCAGPTLYEMIEALVDNDFDQLMNPEGLEDVEFVKGHANGLCSALAVLRNPYFPNIDVIKSEAVVRYEERKAAEEDDEDADEA